MTQVIISRSYRIDVSERELRLIGLALSGRLAGKHVLDVDRLEAAELNRRLLEVRRVALVDELDRVNGAIEKVDTTSRKEPE